MFQLWFMNRSWFPYYFSYWTSKMFSIFSISNNAVDSILLHGFLGKYKSFSKIYKLEVVLLGSRKCSSAAYQILSNCSPKWLSVGVMESSHCYVYLSSLGIVKLLKFTNVMDAKWYLIGILICIVRS